MIKSPGAEGNNYIPELQSLGFVNGQNLNRVNLARELYRFFMTVILPPFKESSKIISFAAIKLKHEILESQQVSNLTLLIAELKYSDECFSQFDQRQLFQHSLLLCERRREESFEKCLVGNGEHFLQ